MTWYPDLSKYSYLEESIPPGETILNVGWLDSQHDFPVGDPPDGFLEALKEMCAGNAHARTRGWHACNLPHAQQLDYPCTIEVSGEKIPLGSAEIRIAAEDGAIISAPNLVLHYVDYHRYLPPDVFIEAVLAHRGVTLQARSGKPPGIVALSGGGAV